MGQGIKEDVTKFCELHKDILTAAKLSADDVTHALGLVSLHTHGSSVSKTQQCSFTLQCLLTKCLYRTAAVDEVLITTTRSQH